ncbi:MAG: RNA polymerase sigma factor [Myxococcales bacterium]|nr:RNA polymerase sigma factor [Myxococcales bacterium]
MLAEAERAPSGPAPAAEAPLFAAERRLAAAVARGERAAATEFARRLLPVARRVTLALVGPVADADDLCQGALVELLESAHTYAGRGPLEAWARRIIARRSLRTLRASRRVQIVEFGEAHGEGPAALESLREDLPRAVDEYLAALPESQRTALLLRHALGHTLVEIAEITGAPVPTVKSRVLTALTTIRRLIRRDLHLGQGPKQARPG